MRGFNRSIPAEVLNFKKIRKWKVEKTDFEEKSVFFMREKNNAWHTAGYLLLYILYVQSRHRLRFSLAELGILILLKGESYEQ